MSRPPYSERTYVQTIVRSFVFSDRVIFNARHPPCAFISVGTYRLSVWDLSLGIDDNITARYVTELYRRLYLFTYLRAALAWQIQTHTLKNSLYLKNYRKNTWLPQRPINLRAINFESCVINIAIIHKNFIWKWKRLRYQFELLQVIEGFRIQSIRGKNLRWNLIGLYLCLFPLKPISLGLIEKTIREKRLLPPI